MKNQVFLLAVSAGLLCGCAHQYVMKLSNGTQVIAASKPHLQGANYHFKDALGRDNAVPQSRVMVIEPASMAQEESKVAAPRLKKRKWYWPF